MNSGLETRGVKAQRKGSRKLWKLMHRRMRIAAREFREYAANVVFGEPSGHGNIGLGKLVRDQEGNSGKNSDTSPLGS